MYVKQICDIINKSEYFYMSNDDDWRLVQNLNMQKLFTIFNLDSEDNRMWKTSKCQISKREISESFKWQIWHFILTDGKLKERKVTAKSTELLDVNVANT